MLAVHLLALLQAQGISLSPLSAWGDDRSGPGTRALCRDGFRTALITRSGPMLASVSLIALGRGPAAGRSHGRRRRSLLLRGRQRHRSRSPGCVPLALFGPFHYAALMGRIARPTLIAQALAPLPRRPLIGAAGARLRSPDPRRPRHDQCRFPHCPQGPRPMRDAMMHGAASRPEQCVGCGLYWFPSPYCSGLEAAPGMIASRIGRGP